VAVGPDSAMSKVHPGFKCILIVDRDEFRLLDPPLWSRFEKQNLNERDDIDKSLVKQLTKWMKTFSSISKGFRIEETFPSVSISFRKNDIEIKQLPSLIRKHQ
jgi:hypothetical protein